LPLRLIARKGAKTAKEGRYNPPHRVVAAQADSTQRRKDRKGRQILLVFLATLRENREPLKLSKFVASLRPFRHAWHAIAHRCVALVQETAQARLKRQMSYRESS
jgi:hypothetical protein